MEIPAILLSAFPPAANLLFDRVRRETDDAMLTVIANADYGNEADAMEVELRSIRDLGRIPHPLSFMLGEVLTLSHYLDPDEPIHPQFRPGRLGPRGHRVRLFACVVLLQVEAAQSHEYRLDTESALAKCLASAKVLGEEINEALARYLTWRLSRPDDEYEALIFAMALLILAIRLHSGRLTEADLGVIARWMLAVESSHCHLVIHDTGCWRPLLSELRLEAALILDEDVRTDVELCGLLLEPPW